ncbi:MAG: formylglycine-generating enzyme family protein [Magnetococcus sp. DMHC-1]|nr:formylglycine-generating enzyme family protein [Magnetococcales bacterium]
MQRILSCFSGCLALFILYGYGMEEAWAGKYKYTEADLRAQCREDAASDRIPADELEEYLRGCLQNLVQQAGLSLSDTQIAAASRADARNPGAGRAPDSGRDQGLDASAPQSRTKPSGKTAKGKHTEADLRRQCREDAVEDRVTDDEMTDYLQGCLKNLARQAGVSLTGEEESPVQEKPVQAPQARVRKGSESVLAGAQGIEFVKIPAGTFEIGCGTWQSNCFNSEKPAQQARVEQFELGRYEVTQGQWQAVMGKNPAKYKSCGENCPVEQVSWNDVQELINQLNAQGGNCRYRLPTEAEWEFACRSGGDPEKFCGGHDIDLVAWHEGNAEGKTHPVGKKAKNGLGLYDMSGNVWEWTCSEMGRYGDPDKSHTRCGSGDANRVLRGGSWYYTETRVRSTNRFDYDPGYRNGDIGVRLARTCP